MPVIFVNNFGVKVRVDCIDVFTDRPVYLPRAETWFHYKHYCTGKLLLAICPQGCYIVSSVGICGRRASNELITEDSGFKIYRNIKISYLPTGAAHIAENSGLCPASLDLLASAKLKRQLSI